MYFHIYSRTKPESLNFPQIQLTSGAYGCSGQRCLALTTAVMVGEAKEWIPEIVEEAKKFNVSAG